MKIEFNILANATDSITQAIALIAWRDEPDDARRLKQAVVAVAHGVELLLKERLRRVHPVLIWENIDRFPSLSVRTVTVDTAQNRLIRIGGLQFIEDDAELISSLRDTRNAIEHYAWTTTKAEADRIVGRALEFAIHFAKTELGYDFFGFGTHKDGTLEDLLESNSHFADAFHSRDKKLANAVKETRILCDYCHSLAVHPTTGACTLCGHWNDMGGDDLPF